MHPRSISPMGSKRGKKYVPGILVIIGCSKRKKRTARSVSAIKLYQGTTFKYGVRFCRKYHLRFLVLSGKYGLIFPRRKITYYNHKIRPNNASGIIPSIQRTLENSINSHPIHTILVLAGSVYISTIIPVIQKKPHLRIFGVPAPKGIFGLRKNVMEVIFTAL